MKPLTIKHGDKHDVRLSIIDSPIDLSLGVAKVHVTPALSSTAQTFNASVGTGNLVTWTLDGTLAAGRYKLEVEVTVGASIVTAPNDGNIELVVVQDLA